MIGIKFTQYDCVYEMDSTFYNEPALTLRYSIQCIYAFFANIKANSCVNCLELDYLVKY